MSDNLTPEQRTYCMRRIKGQDTGPEVLVRSELHKRGLRFRKHVKTLPGKPDIVFPAAKLVVFVDGDFWHGYGFGSWGSSLSSYWQEKIARTRARDRRNASRLRRMGWRVMRVWGHSIEADVQGVVDRIVRACPSQPRPTPPERGQA